MSDSDKPFIARCALVTFIASLALPPFLYALGGGRHGMEEMVVFVGGALLLIALILGIIARRHLPAKIAVIGVLALVCGLAGLINFALYRSRVMQAEMQATMRAKMEAAMAEAHAQMASQYAASLANLEAAKRFDVRPFSSSNDRAVLKDGRWHWHSVAGYGMGDIEADVSFAVIEKDAVAGQKTAKLDVKLLDNASKVRDPKESEIEMLERLEMRLFVPDQNFNF